MELKCTAGIPNSRESEKIPDEELLEMRIRIDAFRVPWRTASMMARAFDPRPDEKMANFKNLNALGNMDYDEKCNEIGMESQLKHAILWCIHENNPESASTSTLFQSDGVSKDS